MREDRERQSLISEVSDQIKFEIRCLLEKQPELIAACQAVVDEAVENQLLKIDSGDTSVTGFNEPQSIGAKYRQRKKRVTGPKLITK